MLRLWERWCRLTAEFLMRWWQVPFASPTTGDRVYPDLDSLLELCRRRNSLWGPEDDWSWAVEYSLTPRGKPTKEIVEYFDGIGIPAQVRKKLTEAPRKGTQGG